MISDPDFLENLSTLGSLRSLCGLLASRTEKGELNSLLNDAYKELGILETKLRQSQKNDR